MPTPNSSSSASEALLRGRRRRGRSGCPAPRAEGRVPAPPPPGAAPSDGDEADHRPPHDRAGDPRPETALPAGRVDRPAEEGDAERVDAVAEDARAAPARASAPRAPRRDATVSAPTPRLRRTVSGTSSRPDMASTNAMPLNSTARLAVAPDGAIASSLTAPRRALVAVARDDEERRSRSAIASPITVVMWNRMYVERSKPWPISADEPERDARSRRARSTSGTTAATTAPNTSTRITSAAGKAEVELARLQVVGEDLVEVTIGAALAGDRHVEVASVGGRDDLRSAGRRPPRSRPMRPTGISGRATVFRDEGRVAALVRAARVVDDAGGAYLAEHVRRPCGGTRPGRRSGSRSGRGSARSTYSSCGSRGNVPARSARSRARTPGWR